MLPTAVTSLLTMINVKDFLEDGVYDKYLLLLHPSFLTTSLFNFDRFITPADKKNAGGKKDDSIVISRIKNRGEPPVRYLVIDNPTKLQPKDW